jgi:hypothetical protein
LGWRQANPLAPLNLISDQALRAYPFVMLLLITFTNTYTIRPWDASFFAPVVLTCVAFGFAYILVNVKVERRNIEFNERSSRINLRKVFISFIIGSVGAVLAITQVGFHVYAIQVAVLCSVVASWLAIDLFHLFEHRAK